jgi:predicted  nucleic acid-binding Zn ribbon protein
VNVQDNMLKMPLQGRKDETYELKHYQNDSFSWLQPRGCSVSRGRWVLQPASYDVFHFEADDYRRVDNLFWATDLVVLEESCS